MDIYNLRLLLIRLRKRGYDPAILNQIAYLLDQVDDPVWLENLASVSDGEYSPLLAELLAYREPLRRINPRLVDRLETLCQPVPPDLALRPDYPTFMEQFQPVQPQPTFWSRLAAAFRQPMRLAAVGAMALFMLLCFAGFFVSGLFLIAANPPTRIARQTTATPIWTTVALPPATPTAPATATPSPVLIAQQPTATATSVPPSPTATLSPSPSPAPPTFTATAKPSPSPAPSTATPLPLPPSATPAPPTFTATATPLPLDYTNLLVREEEEEQREEQPPTPAVPPTPTNVAISEATPADLSTAAEEPTTEIIFLPIQMMDERTGLVEFSLSTPPNRATLVLSAPARLSYYTTVDLVITPADMQQPIMPLGEIANEPLQRDITDLLAETNPLGLYFELSQPLSSTFKAELILIR